MKMNKLGIIVARTRGRSVSGIVYSNAEVKSFRKRAIKTMDAQLTLGPAMDILMVRLSFWTDSVDMFRYLAY